MVQIFDRGAKQTIKERKEQRKTVDDNKSRGEKRAEQMKGRDEGITGGRKERRSYLKCSGR